MVCCLDKALVKVKGISHESGTEKTHCGLFRLGLVRGLERKLSQ